MQLSSNSSLGGSKTLRLCTNPLEPAAPDPLGTQISMSGATGCSNRPLQSHWVLESAAPEPLGAPRGVQIGCSGATRDSNRNENNAFRSERLSADLKEHLKARL